MHTKALLHVLAAATIATAQRPANTSICDFYTTALLVENNATNQETLVTLLVNTAVIGNYTKPNANLTVPGILAQGQSYNKTSVNLLPYFDGALASTNRGGELGVSINFLDDGGATPLTLNKPSNTTTSNQYKLLTHLYGYFGILLGCSHLGQTGYPAYSGDTSMYDVHKFMALDAYQVGWFIEQVGLSAKSFGVADADVEYVGTALQTLFGQKCAAKLDIVPGAADELQAICIAEDCPTAANATCSAYAAVVTPKHVNGSITVSGTATASSTATSTSTSKSAGSLTRNVCGSLLLLFALGTVRWLW
ncbi:hypothetical protein LTR36_004888 [Oleoguttula mirabilis]|uniref:Uncharacterized protein n=1 Tax=Oleoguttula mirabilis TaxID=1507867 RepID=A0AAV9JF48_9PEZI|nr:hypothetical protein LTR36_004888 [Oleoguttula mirabilis]